MPSADQLLGVVWRRRLTFVVTFACVLAAIAAVTYSLPKTYSTSAYLVVSSVNPSSSDFAAQQVSQVETQTTAELLQTRNTANQVAAQLPYHLSGQEVQSSVSISPVAQTQLVLISASGSSPLRAQQLADTYTQVFEQQTAPTITFAHIRVAESAPLVSTPSAPRVHLYLLVGAVFALLVAVGLAVLRERLDRSVRIDDFATELFGLPILARVPEVAGRGRRAAVDHHDIRFVEGFRWVFANLAFVSGGERPEVIAVISSGEQDGKSTVCVAIANAAEEILSGGVLLVDADLRRPTLAQRLGIREHAGDGLSTYLSDPHPDPGAVERMRERVPDSRIGLVPAGPQPPSPASLLGLSAFDGFVQEAKEISDLVIFDTPPVGAGADASLIATRADGAVLVVDGRRSRRTSVEWSLEQMRRAGVKVLGVIVNRVSEPGALSYNYTGERGGRGRGRRRLSAGQSREPSRDTSRESAERVPSGQRD